MTNYYIQWATVLAIDIANAFGKDKKVFETRIQWVKDNLDNLESFKSEADEPLLYVKAVASDTQAGLPVGHMVELDATTSGLQIMSALTGCPTGAKWTNLIDPSKRYDAYSESFGAMKTYLTRSIREITRAMAKNALMTSFYGSNAQPVKIFGNGTPELDAFFTMCEKRLKGCWELKEDLIALGQTPKSEHNWTLPDGFQARVVSTTKERQQCEVAELEGYKFITEYKEYGKETSTISLAANVIHSIDGWMVRDITQVNYDVDAVKAQQISLRLHCY